MEDTLVEIIEKLEGLKEYLNFEGKLSKYTEKILRKFYQEDPLAYKVAASKESYVKLIKPIEEKYNSFWKRIRVPRTDKTFDNEVRRVIESMNNVGVEYINPENFTTDRKRRHNKNILLISAGTGLFFAALPKLIEWSYTANYNGPGNLNIFVPITAAGVMYLGNKLLAYPDTNLAYLQKFAQKTDEFLRQHYLKLSPT
ncbi:MAG: hypothetical protein KKA61_03060 [Nanoarchaeota archaeon]|nr:hypothetical protein [Nanoarchaeota archaeon]MBU4493325.1 hypothetical protein [Nanoarchaeota archaeon]